MSESNSTSNEEQTVNEVEEALSKGADNSKTLPPSADHGWLEQFSAFGKEAWDELMGVAGQGLSEAEAGLLTELAAKLMKEALKHDPKALDKFDAAF